MIILECMKTLSISLVKPADTKRVVWPDNAFRQHPVVWGAQGLALRLWGPTSIELAMALCKLSLRGKVTSYSVFEHTTYFSFSHQNSSQRFKFNGRK